MIDSKIYNYNYEELVEWLENCGSSNPDYFSAKKSGGLKLQQVPYEYAKLLLFFKDKKIKRYLELGIGNGGSFITNCFFMQENLETALAVDDLSYGELIRQNDIEINSFIENIAPCLPEQALIKFINSNTHTFFQNYKSDKFDCIFIDADHGYEGVKRDYQNSLKHILKGGHIVFHDIASVNCEGVRRIWQEVKKVHSKSYEFIHGTNCGIGIIEI